MDTASSIDATLSQKSQPATLRVIEVDVGPLSRVCFEVAAGTVVTLSGASGSGKSRLLRAMADLEPHGGEIFWGDVRQSDCLPPEWRQRIMMVPAESHWWFDRVGDHFPVGAEVDYPAVGLMRDTGDWQIDRLSSGEKQRLALLRAVATRPEVLLLDEPTANLDPDNVAQIEGWLQAMAVKRSLTLVWVAHDPAQAERVADHQLKIQNGTVLAL
ncbi:ABC transporter ATP-binding protein [Marinobacter sp. 1Y8]